MRNLIEIKHDWFYCLVVVATGYTAVFDDGNGQRGTAALFMVIIIIWWRSHALRRWCKKCDVRNTALEFDGSYKYQCPKCGEIYDSRVSGD